MMNLKNESYQVPWVVYEAKEWLDNYLKKSMKVFEWGSGGSTLYFCKKVKNVFSVEHDNLWYKEVSRVMSDSGIKNCKYYLVKPKKNYIKKALPYHKHLYNSRTFTKYTAYSFKDYVKKIDIYPNNSFDVVFVDGRARASCIKHALKKVKPGGILILDNSERLHYQKMMKNLSEYTRKDFYGKGPYSNKPWQTTVWVIK